MYLPMTSIQDAWGVTTLDDRSDTTIKPPIRRTNNNNPSDGVRNIPTVSQAPVNDPNFVPYTLNKLPVVTHKLPNKMMDEQQLVGLLTLLMIFVLMDKLLTIWKQS